MSVKKEIFGIHPSGKEVYKFEIVNKQGMKAVITNFGAILISLFVKDKKGKGIQIIYGPQVTVIKSDFEEYVKCAQGDIVPIENVPDSVFADKLLGDGIAINPSNGEIISPIDGRVVMIQDSLHAIGIQSEDGIEILIHVGLDTVELKGEGFVKKVNINDRVNKGQPIVYFDKEMIEEKGYNTITMMIVVNNERISKLEKGNQLDKPLIKVQYK